MEQLVIGSARRSPRTHRALEVLKITNIHEGRQYLEYTKYRESMRKKRHEVTVLNLWWNPEPQADPPSPPSQIWSGHGTPFRWVVGSEWIRRPEIRSKRRGWARAECFEARTQGQSSEEHRVSAALLLRPLH